MQRHRQPARAHPPGPDLVRSLGLMSAEDFTNACAAWFDQANRLQEETLRFAQQRLAKDLETANRLARCTNPTDAFNLQVDFAATAAADYLAEGQRMVAMFGEAAKEGASSDHQPRGSRN